MIQSRISSSLFFTFQEPRPTLASYSNSSTLIFLGAGIVSTVYLACCKSSLCWDMYSGAAFLYFFFSLSFLCFLPVVFLLKCVKWGVPLPPSPFPLHRTTSRWLHAGTVATLPEGRVNLCLHVCMCKIDRKMSMNSRKSSGRPSYYYRLLRRSRLQRQRSRSRSRNRPLSRGNCNELCLIGSAKTCWCLQVAALLCVRVTCVSVTCLLPVQCVLGFAKGHCLCCRDVRGGRAAEWRSWAGQPGCNSSCNCN